MSCGSVAAISDSRARSISTPERTETVDVHHSREPRSIGGHRADVDVEREMEVESPVTSNNSATSSSPQHHPSYHYQPQTPSGVFHSLPRTGGSSALPSPSAGQNQSPCSSPSLTSRPDRGSPPTTTTTTKTDNNNSSMQLATGQNDAVRSQSLSCRSQEEEDSVCSSEYTDPNTFPTEVAARENTVSVLEDPISRDSYELLSESEPIFFSPDRFTKDEEVPYILHRRLQTSMISSKSCETVIRYEDGSNAYSAAAGEEADSSADAESFHIQRSRSFRSLREKTYRERPHALFARARLVEIDLNVIDPQPALHKSSLFRPKSIEFVSFQNLPPPDAFSSRDDTVDPAVVVAATTTTTASADSSGDVEFFPSHFTSTAVEPCFPVVVDVDRESQEAKEVSGNESEDDDDEDKMCSLMSQTEEEIVVTATSSISIERLVEDQASALSFGHLPAETEDDEALTADDVRDVDFVYQDTLSSTSLEEHLISEDQIFEFVNEEDGLPDPDSLHEGIYDRVASVEYVFQAHVLSRISEHSCDSKLSSCTDDGGCGDALQEQNNTMSDVSSSFKASEAAAAAAAAAAATAVEEAAVDTAAMPLCCLPPPPSFEETTPVNETVVFDPPPYPTTMMDEFPSPPSSIDNLPDEESYSDSSS